VEQIGPQRTPIDADMKSLSQKIFNHEKDETHEKEVCVRDRESPPREVLGEQNSCPESDWQSSLRKSDLI
jgi:hypothetical protein